MPALADNIGPRHRLGVAKYRMVQDMAEILFMDGLHFAYNFAAHAVTKPDYDQILRLVQERMRASVDGKPQLRTIVNAVVKWRAH